MQENPQAEFPEKITWDFTLSVQHRHFEIAIIESVGERVLPAC